MKRKFTFFFCLTLVVFTLASGCKKDKVRSDDTLTQVVGPVDYLKKYLAESFGIDQSKIVFVSKSKLFIVDGDMLISLEQVQKNFDNEKNNKNTTIKHYKHSVMVDQQTAKDIKLIIDSTVTSDWQVAINNAVNNWNSISTSTLRFRIVTDPRIAHTRINAYERSALSDTIANAWLPTSTTTPGNPVSINTRFNYLAADKKTGVITHELGHVIGLLHTNETLGTYITGSPQVDPGSIMNSNPSPWTAFSAGDISVIEGQYPRPVTTYSYQFGPNSWSSTYQYTDGSKAVRSYYVSAGTTVSGICAVSGSVSGGQFYKGSLCP